MTQRKNARQPCSIEGCDRLHAAHGWCQLHYERWQRNGHPGFRGPKPMLDRIATKFLVGDDCWEWIGGKTTAGYGMIANGAGNQPVYAHRVLYELLVGSIPDGLTIDHLCRNRACVRPDHLEAVTLKENIQRGFTSRRAEREKDDVAHST